MQSAISRCKLYPVPLLYSRSVSCHSALLVFSRGSKGLSGVRVLATAAGDSAMTSSIKRGSTGTLAGTIVALGKFDALHIGHRSLAEQAAKMGPAVLLSFTGMGEILGWEKRLPLVAECDRRRILSLWAAQCEGMVPAEFALEFGKVRQLSPQHFVQKLATEFHVKGVVAGTNYRFGYKAAGDASDLVRLCTECDLEVFIVDPVMDTFEEAPPVMGDLNAREKGQVSSTRVRKALADGKMKRVTDLLGRKHRLITTIIAAVSAAAEIEDGIIRVPLSNALNQPPSAGRYQCSLSFFQHSEICNADDVTMSCEVIVSGSDIVVKDAAAIAAAVMTEKDGYLSIEF